MIVSARELVLNAGKPAPRKPVPQAPHPLVVWIDAGEYLVPLEIPLTKKFKAAQAGTGFASLIFHGCTIKNTTDTVE